jgi:Magnesium chelatase, subunit ChlI
MQLLRRAGQGVEIDGLLLAGRVLLFRHPSRTPHHAISGAGLIGGGGPGGGRPGGGPFARLPRPGEVSLAHHGVLFLDELPTFRQDVLEALRQPLGDAIVTLAGTAFTNCWVWLGPSISRGERICPINGYALRREFRERCTSATVTFASPARFTPVALLPHQVRGGLLSSRLALRCGSAEYPIGNLPGCPSGDSGCDSGAQPLSVAHTGVSHDRRGYGVSGSGNGSGR